MDPGWRTRGTRRLGGAGRSQHRSSRLDGADPLMTVVVIAEKPSVADDIAKVLGATKKADDAWLGDELVVTWAIGHLVEQKFPEDYDPEFKNWRKTIDRLPIVPDPFEYKAKGGRNRKVLSAIKKRVSAKDVTEIVNACDAAREGELISGASSSIQGQGTHVKDVASSMTAGAIKTAWKDANQAGHTTTSGPLRVHARSRLDHRHERITCREHLPEGRRERTTISLGRVQTATLAMIADEEKKILSYVPEPFWTSPLTSMLAIRYGRRAGFVAITSRMKTGLNTRPVASLTWKRKMPSKRTLRQPNPSPSPWRSDQSTSASPSTLILRVCSAWPTASGRGPHAGRSASPKTSTTGTRSPHTRVQTPNTCLRT